MKPPWVINGLLLGGILKNRAAILLFGRVLGMVLVAMAGPWFHVRFGQDSQNADIDGPQAFGFLFAFLALSGFVGFLGFVVGTAVQIVFPRRFTLCAAVDVFLFLSLLALVICGGVTAQYSG